jgi:hypothetical protein
MRPDCFQTQVANSYRCRARAGRRSTSFTLRLTGPQALRNSCPAEWIVIGLCQSVPPELLDDARDESVINLGLDGHAPPRFASIACTSPSAMRARSLTMPPEASTSSLPAMLAGNESKIRRASSIASLKRLPTRLQRLPPSRELRLRRPTDGIGWWPRSFPAASGDSSSRPFQERPSIHATGA